MELQTEIDTGMDAIDNQFTPYDITISLAPNERKEFSIICSIEKAYEKDAFTIISHETKRIQKVIDQAGYQDPFARDLVQSSDWFITKRQSTGYKTILAGLPWYTDWGHDTMIALHGLTLSTKRYEDAKEILLTFATYVKNGLVPNMFPDANIEPLYNTVDASLWYFYAVDQYLSHVKSPGAYTFIQEFIFPKLEEIMKAYQTGTLFSIYMDTDGLLHAGSGLDQVTWMDVRVDDWVVTPRHGKPVEINALWYNAIKVMEKLSKIYKKEATSYSKLAQLTQNSFISTFWNSEKNCLFDVVSGTTKDASIRPNQIWAISLPFTMLTKEMEVAILDTVFTHLYIGCGLRSLSPFDKEYIGKYFGELHQRDAAYHQGTAWAFPLGAFITAYIKVHGPSPETICFAEKLLEPIKNHLTDGCVGSIAEIFDGDPPHISRGCYAQAWSVGEILRAYTENILPFLPK